VDHTTLAILVAVAMAVGVVGTVVPVVPGLALVWGAALVYGLVDGFGAVGVVAMVVITALAVAGTVAGIAIPRRAAGATGAAASSLWLGGALAIVGFFAVPVVGLPLGGALGIFVGEQLRTKDTGLAWRATRATLTGFGVAALVQVGAALAMVAAWVVWLLAS
jgi:uncharacterized protein YqgC (DUF456 family)